MSFLLKFVKISRKLAIWKWRITWRFPSVHKLLIKTVYDKFFWFCCYETSIMSGKSKQHFHVDSFVVFDVWFNYVFSCTAIGCRILLSNKFLGFSLKWFNSMTLSLIELCTHFRFSVSWLWIRLRQLALNYSHSTNRTKVIGHKRFLLQKSLNLFDFLGPLNPPNLHRSTVDWNFIYSSVHSPNPVCLYWHKREKGPNTEQHEYFRFIKQPMSLLDLFSSSEGKKRKAEKKKCRNHTLSIRYVSDDWPCKSKHMTSASRVSGSSVVVLPNDDWPFSSKITCCWLKCDKPYI